jgi:hypothetical protein
MFFCYYVIIGISKSCEDGCRISYSSDVMYHEVGYLMVKVSLIT